MKIYDVLAIGVAAVDDLLYVPTYPPANVKVPITRSARHAGGLAVTAIAAAGVLSGRTAYVARLGNDELSTFIKTSLAAKNVDVSAVIPDPTGQPFHSTIVIDDTGARTIFYDASRYHPVTAAEFPNALTTAAGVIFLDYLVDPPAIDLAKKIRAAGTPILADIEGRSDSCLPLLPLIDYLIVSEEFARWAAHTDDLSAACAHLAQSKRKATIVTAGPNGCYLVTDSAPMHIPAFEVEAIDTNGCGDTFHGAYALAIARNLNPLDAAIFASAAAALKASGPGGWDSLPTAANLNAFLRSRLPQDHLTSNLMACVNNLESPKNLAN
jgi:sugar/nucleoside kinase (ribokinase family)